MSRIYRRRTWARILLMILSMFATVRLGLAPAFGSQVILGFGAHYGNPQRTHSGADVAFKRGDSVFAPTSGTISFVGRVPGVGGAYVLAATILTPDGRKVTLLPFASTSVKKGDSVEAGQSLGFACGVGDGSSDVEHIHISVREGDRYLDPSFLLLQGVSAPPANDEAKETSLTAEPKRAANPTHSGVHPPSIATIQAFSASSSNAKVSHPQRIIQAEPQTAAAETLIRRLERIDGVPSLHVSQAYQVKESHAEPDDRHMYSQSVWTSFCMLSREEKALWLFLGGLILPCAGIGAVVVGRRTGLGNQAKKVFLAVRGNR